MKKKPYKFPQNIDPSKIKYPSPTTKITQIIQNPMYYQKSLTPRFAPNNNELHESDAYVQETIKIENTIGPNPTTTETIPTIPTVPGPIKKPPYKSQNLFLQGTIIERMTNKRTIYLNMALNNFPVKFHLFEKGTTHPRELYGFYGDLDEIVGTLAYKKNGYLSNDVQILKCVNNSNKKIVIKRCVIRCTLQSSEEIKQNDGKEMEFLKNCFEEYYISKIVSSHPAGLQSIDFQISLLINHGLLVTEFLMEDGGQELGSFCKEHGNDYSYYDLILNFMKESVYVLRFMQKMKLKYGDLKSQNFLVDTNGKLKIIDFNISQIGGLGRSTDEIIRNEIKGYTLGYVSPEIYNIVISHAPGSPIRKYCKDLDSWSSDMYSWGMLFLLLLKGVNSDSELMELDKFKNKEDLHEQNIISKIKKIQFKNIEMKDKIEVILHNCLAFNPENRLCFKVLDDIMKNIEKDSKKTIEEKIKGSKKEAIEWKNRKSGIFSKETKINSEIVSQFSETYNKLNDEIAKNRQHNDDFHKFKKDISVLIKCDFNENTDLKNIYEIVKKRVYKYKEKIQSNKKYIQELYFLLKNNCLDGKLFQRNNKEIIKKSLMEILNKFFHSVKIKHDIVVDPAKSLFEKESTLYSLFYEYFILNKTDSKNCTYNNCKTQHFHPSLTLNNDLKSNSIQCIYETCDKKALKHHRKAAIDNIIYKNNSSWGFHNKMCKKSELLYIISCIPTSNSIKEIDFGNNMYFDEDCADHYINFLILNKSLRGIILYHTSISPQTICKFLSLFKFKTNIQYCIIDKYGLSQILLDSIAQNLQLDVNNWNAFDEILFSEIGGSNSQSIQLYLSNQNFCYYGKKLFYKVNDQISESNYLLSSIKSSSSKLYQNYILEKTFDPSKISSIHLLDDLWLLTRRNYTKF